MSADSLWRNAFKPSRAIKRNGCGWRAGPSTSRLAAGVIDGLAHLSRINCQEKAYRHSPGHTGVAGSKTIRNYDWVVISTRQGSDLNQGLKRQNIRPGFV